VQESSRPAHQVSLGRWELPIELLVVANLIALAFETVPELSPFWHQALWSFEVFCAAVYTVEYTIRVFLAQPRWRYMVSFYGIIDLLAIAPFYLMVAFNMQAVRAFRLLRLLRLFKLVRYTNAVQRFRRAFTIARDDLVLFGVSALIVLYLAAIGIYHFEHEVQPERFTSFFASLWWAVATLTTVGYGDVTPMTPLGKLFGAIVTVIGIGMAAMPAGILANGLAKQFEKRNQELKAQYRKALADGVIDESEREELERLRREYGLTVEEADEIRKRAFAARGAGARCPHCGEPLESEGGQGPAGS